MRAYTFLAFCEICGDEDMHLHVLFGKPRGGDKCCLNCFTFFRSMIINADSAYKEKIENKDAQAKIWKARWLYLKFKYLYL